MTLRRRPRVIPVLLVRGEGLVKGRGFAEPQYVGDPVNAIRIFNEKEVDEIIVLDILASSENRPPRFELARDVASECFMPICFGGGVATIEHMDRLFAAGVEKVSINTGSTDAALIQAASARFGSQSVVAAMDVRSGWFGRRKVVVKRGTRAVHDDPVAWAKRMRDLGAGEILLQSIDRDGAMAGYDLELVQSVAAAVDIPVIALGGAGSVADLRNGLTAGAAAVAAGSMFVFHGRHRAVLITYPTAAELDSLIPVPTPTLDGN